MKRLGALLFHSLISISWAQSLNPPLLMATNSTSPNAISPLQEDVIFMMYFYFLVIALFFISCTIFRLRLVQRGQRLFDSMHPDEEQLFHEALILSAYGDAGHPLMLQHNSKLEEPLINSKDKTGESQPLLAEESGNQRTGQREEGGEIELQKLESSKSKEFQKEELDSDGKAKSEDILKGNDSLLQNEEDMKRAKKEKKRQIIEGTYDFEGDKSLAKTNVGPGSFPFSDMKMSL